MTARLLIPYDDAKAIIANPDFEKWITEVTDAEAPHLEFFLEPDARPHAIFREWMITATFTTEIAALLFRLRWM